jgi:hypothetical protein
MPNEKVPIPKYIDDEIALAVADRKPANPAANSSRDRRARGC